MRPDSLVLLAIQVVALPGWNPHIPGLHFIPKDPAALGSRARLLNHFRVSDASPGTRGHHAVPSELVLNLQDAATAGAMLSLLASYGREIQVRYATGISPTTEETEDFPLRWWVEAPSRKPGSKLYASGNTLGEAIARFVVTYGSWTLDGPRYLNP